MANVFISYAHKDAPIAKKIAYELRKSRNGEHFIWMDTERLFSGNNWASKIRLGLRETDVIIAIYTQNYFDDRTYSKPEKAASATDQVEVFSPADLEKRETRLLSVTPREWTRYECYAAHFQGKLVPIIVGEFRGGDIPTPVQDIQATKFDIRPIFKKEKADQNTDMVAGDISRVKTTRHFASQVKRLGRDLVAYEPIKPKAPTNRIHKVLTTLNLFLLLVIVSGAAWVGKFLLDRTPFADMRSIPIEQRLELLFFDIEAETNASLCTDHEHLFETMSRYETRPIEFQSKKTYAHLAQQSGATFRHAPMFLFANKARHCNGTTDNPVNTIEPGEIINQLVWPLQTDSPA